MAKKKTDEATGSLVSANPDIARPRLQKLIIKNFRAIGQTPVVIELDDIVVLVGPNNAGKSSILRAYELVMSHGSSACKLTPADYPNGKFVAAHVPEIELYTVVYDNTPGADWITEDKENKELIVRERWMWDEAGEPTRQGFNVKSNEWDDKVPWGAPNVANANRPQPHRVDAFAPPEVQAEEIVKLLTAILNERVKAAQEAKVEGAEKSDYGKLLDEVTKLQKQIVKESKAEIDAVEKEISDLLKQVFPDYQVQFDARPEDDVERCVNLFKAGARLLMGPTGGYLSPVDRQGSGARRTLLWTALRILADSTLGKKKAASERPHVLLIDEPEICLHPSAIREACRVLYDLPKGKRWQVMATTHSPAFVDFSKDNTTIIRVERVGGNVQGTTVFRPQAMKLDEDDKLNLKLLNLCDPYVAEFFFGGKTIVVEGDTEYTAFRYLLGLKPDKYRDIHVVRARGKSTIVSLAKVLNHFGASYAILHDSDKPRINGKKSKKERANPAWGVNPKILDVVKKKHAASAVRLLASIPNFEAAYFGEEVEDEKPYNALVKMRSDPKAFAVIEVLFEALINHASEVPPHCLQWKDLAELEKAVAKSD